MPEDEKTLRCAVCRVRLGLIPFTCKCQRHFCAKHRTGLRQQVYGSTIPLAERSGHLCDYDHTGVHAERLQLQLDAQASKKTVPFFP